MNLEPQASRRGFLRQTGLLGLAVAAVTFLPRMAYAAWNKAAFEVKSVAEVYQALGVSSPSASADIQLNASDIAENGAVVPVEVISKIPNTTQISFLVDKNPTILTAPVRSRAGYASRNQHAREDGPDFQCHRAGEG